MALSNRYERMFHNQSPMLRDIHKLSKLIGPDKVPRDDLQEDHHLWVVVLASAKELFPDNPYVFTTLHGLRCCGAMLVENDTATGLRLLPGEIPPAEWEADKVQYLNPIKDQVKEIFSYSSIGLLINKLAPKEEVVPAPAGKQEKLF